jgi:hypothetical protein
MEWLMMSQFDVEAGRDRLIDILKQEGRWAEFEKFRRRGQFSKLQAIVEDVVNRHRSELDEVMK